MPCQKARKHAETLLGKLDKRSHAGRKRWLVYAPGEMPSPALHGAMTVDGRPEFASTDGLPEAQRPIQCMQQPGEVVYLPSGFLHATYNIDVSASGIAVAVGAQQAAEDVRNTMLRIVKVRRANSTSSKFHQQIPPAAPTRHLSSHCKAYAIGSNPIWSPHPVGYAQGQRERRRQSDVRCLPRRHKAKEND